MNNKPNTKEKITLPANTQKEMMKFFLKTSTPKIAAGNQLTNPKEKPLNLVPEVTKYD